jgi:hypothetical protein
MSRRAVRRPVRVANLNHFVKHASARLNNFWPIQNDFTFFWRCFNGLPVHASTPNSVAARTLPPVASSIWRAV